MSAVGAVTSSVLRAGTEILMAATRAQHQWLLEHKQQYLCPAWLQRDFLRPVLWYDFELCSWQCGHQAYFPNLLRKPTGHPYPFNELARDGSYCLQLRILMDAASILK